MRYRRRRSALWTTSNQSARRHPLLAQCSNVERVSGGLGELGPRQVDEQPLQRVRRAGESGLSKSLALSLIDIEHPPQARKSPRQAKTKLRTQVGGPPLARTIVGVKKLLWGH